jgi:hypothetical protein
LNSTESSDVGADCNPPDSERKIQKVCDPCNFAAHKNTAAFTMDTEGT